jgi:hypothetical protein
MMPQIISADKFFGTPCFELPKIGYDEFMAKLTAMLGSGLSAAEQIQTDRMIRHNWTLVVIADALRVARGLGAWPIGRAIPEI